ncbi:MAG: hypothetical protein AB200_02425 [Parcubacteria bacterium C7867-005]|nr:MAG: hypothetical protein AB200_02425 [Parcubacteria bacterium C7867-005]
MEGDQNTNTGSREEGSVGGVIATIIILAIIVLGGLYFWSKRAVDNDGAQNVPALNENSIESIETQSTSDDTSSIEADLNQTDTNIDTEINAS